jgi:hypothetical protein
MGNIFITAISIFLPITIHTSIIPTLMRPDILGGAPWSEPNVMFYTILYFSLLYFFLWLFSVIGNIYYSLFSCSKSNVKQSILYANWTPFFAFCGIFLNNTLFLPFVKGLILAGTTFIPYSHHLVNGALTAPFVFIGTMFSQKYLNQAVCGFF